MIIMMMIKVIVIIVKSVFDNNNNDKSYEWVNEVVVFKTLKLLLNLFQTDGPINEMLFWPKLLFFNVISKAICDLV